jgi:CBS domain-containing protein
VALQFPQILGIGYETVEAMLRDVQLSLLLLVSLLIVKLVMTAVSLGSGMVGGLFAPAMFLGASLGAAYGKVLALLLPLAPGSIAAAPAYAMVGMAAVLAASARAPLTAILLLFELTRDYRIILPLMAAVGLSVWLVDRLDPIAHTTSTSQSSGLSLNSVPDQPLEGLHQLLVAEAMRSEFLSLPDSLPVLQAGLRLTTHGARSALVMDAAEHLVGIVTLQDINRMIAWWEQSARTYPNQDFPLINLTNQRVGEICTTDVLYAYVDELVVEASTRMAARGLRQLPVVDRNNPQHVLGLLEDETIALQCNLATTRELLRPYITIQPKAEAITLPAIQKWSA